MLPQLERRLNTPMTSSMGRLFDAAAALLGIIDKASFEGQAAMMLERQAHICGAVSAMENGYFLHDGVLDFTPLLLEISGIEDSAYGASLFHATLVDGLKSWVIEQGANKVIFSGGCFVNGMLSSELRKCLEGEGLAVFEALSLPPNDGGISLGQCYAAMLEKSSCA